MADQKLQVEGTEVSREVIASVLGKYRAANTAVVRLHTQNGARQENRGVDTEGGEICCRKATSWELDGMRLQEFWGDTGWEGVALTGYMVCEPSLRDIPSSAGAV